MMKKNILSFQKMKKEGDPITWITAYTYAVIEQDKKWIRTKYGIRKNGLRTKNG